jgi:hypothetical protein
MEEPIGFFRMKYRGTLGFPLRISFHDALLSGTASAFDPIVITLNLIQYPRL